MTDAVGDGGEQPARSPDDEWGGGGRVSMGQFWELPAVRAAEFSFNSGYVLAVTEELVSVQLYDAWTDSGGDFRFERSKEVRTLGLTELRTTGTWKAHASVYDAMGGPLVEPMRQVLQGSEEFSAGVMVRIEFKDGRVCIGCQSGHVGTLRNVAFRLIRDTLRAKDKSGPVGARSSSSAAAGASVDMQGTDSMDDDADEPEPSDAERDELIGQRVEVYTVLERGA